MIEVSNLVKNFNSKQVLRNLDLTILPKQRVALVGHNGCGKTTLIRCMLGLYQFNGDIRIDGVSIKNGREEALSKISFVPQHPPALRGTVHEIISMMSRLCDFQADSVTPIARELGLELDQCLSTPFKGLSGGMKQKLLIAMALARSPLILIMDEPTANLDPQARAVFFKLLSQLPEETAMLLTSHRVDELSGIVSRVIEIDDGIITMDDIVDVGGSEELTGQIACKIEFKEMPSSVQRTLSEWSFVADENTDLKWRGNIPAPDSFRFFATLTRWSGIVHSVSSQRIEEQRSHL